MIVNAMFSIREKNSSNKLIKIECIECQVLTLEDYTELFLRENTINMTLENFRTLRALLQTKATFSSQKKKLKLLLQAKAIFSSQ